MFVEVFCNDFVDVLSHVLRLGNRSNINILLGVTYTVTYGNRLDLRLRWFVHGVVLSRKALMNKVWRRRKGIVNKVKVIMSFLDKTYYIDKISSPFAHDV